MITLDTIHAAQNNDLSAIAALLEATESRVAVLAEKAARRMALNGGDRLAQYRDEFTQTARIAVWEALGRFDGSSVDSFFGFTYITVERTLLDAVTEERTGGHGADRDAMWILGSMMEAADGDVYLAEKLAQTVPPKGRRLSADRARAARLAWNGEASLDAPSTDSTGGCEPNGLASVLASTAPEEQPDVSARVGAGLVAVAARSLAATVPMPKCCPKARMRLMDALSAFEMGFGTEWDYAVLERLITVPSDRATRRIVLSALRVLATSLSKTAEDDVPEELETAGDRRNDERERKESIVRAVLDAMGEGQRVVLSHSFGIRGAVMYGHGDSGDNDGLAELLGVKVCNLRPARTKGLKSFAKRYAKVVRAYDPERADELEAAAAINLRAGGRK